MSEWSDEAVKAADHAYHFPEKRHFSPGTAMRAAITAADAVRKREAGEKRDAVKQDPEAIWSSIRGILHRVAAAERRLTALEAARPAETSGYAPFGVLPAWVSRYTPAACGATTDPRGPDTVSRWPGGRSLRI